MAVGSCTLKLSNQKNGWRGVCINHRANGNPIMCPVKALGRWYVHIMSNKHKQGMFLSSYYIGNEKYDVMDADIRSALKAAVVVLN